MSGGVVERFLHGQVACWNAGDKEGFLAHYRAMAPRGLTIEYVGQPARDGWPVLEAMWEAQASRIAIEVQATVISGDEAACHHRNRVIGTGAAIPTIELYRFGDGTLSVRYFIGS